MPNKIQMPMQQPAPDSSRSNGMFDRRYKQPLIVYQNMSQESVRAGCTCRNILLKEVEDLKASYQELVARVQRIEEHG
jgi:hypothetical protein